MIPGNYTNLRAYRAKAKLSRMKLGARAGVDTATIYKIERYGTVPKLNTARALIGVLSEVLGKKLTLDLVFPAHSFPTEEEKEEAS